MKIVLIIATLISGFSFGQTNVIAAKSHSSAKTIDKNDRDNFGLPYHEKRLIQSVEYVKEDCLVETYEVFHDMTEMPTEVDTFCDHPFLKKGKYDVNRIKAMYPAKTTFIGFDQLDSKQKKRIKKMGRKKYSEVSNLLLLFAVVGGLFLTYLLAQRLKTEVS